MGSLGVKFWGTRGLVPSPRPQTAIYGGNTQAIQLMHEDQLILIDSGFGCSNLGDILVPRILRQEALNIHIFFTHFHWDHIQGLPFFQPIYFPSTTLNLYSPHRPEVTLDNLDILFDGSYSPFESLMKMQANIQIHQLTAPLSLGRLHIDFLPVDHGDTHTHGEQTGSEDAYAYRFRSSEGQSVLVMTDHEARPSAKNDALVAFGQDVDILIHDGQWFDGDYAQYVGWGHSSTTQALDNALRMRAKQTLLTHHDPARNDRDILAQHRAHLKMARYLGLDFSFAREDTVYAVTRTKPLAKVS